VFLFIFILSSFSFGYINEGNKTYKDYILGVMKK